MRLFVFNLFLLSSFACVSESELSSNRSITSQHLGYSLQFKVYTPEGYNNNISYPVMFLTDGQWFLSEGEMQSRLDFEIGEGNIVPVIVVFVDSRNPNELKDNRRNKEFMCNKNYVLFYVNELIAEVKENYSISEERNNRVIAGLSFGGINAACFGIAANKYFGGIGMLSPANDQHLGVISKLYKRSNERPLKVFLSGGKKNDNLKAIRKFKKVLVNEGHDINYHEVPFGHDWKNWRPLLDDLLMTFFNQNSKE